MTWLYLPQDALPAPQTHACSASPFAPAMASPRSSPPAPDIVLWAMSNGKPTPQPTSWRDSPVAFCSQKSESFGQMLLALTEREQLSYFGDMISCIANEHALLRTSDDAEFLPR